MKNWPSSSHLYVGSGAAGAFKQRLGSLTFMLQFRGAHTLVHTLVLVQVSFTTHQNGRTEQLMKNVNRSSSTEGLKQLGLSCNLFSWKKIPSWCGQSKLSSRCSFGFVTFTLRWVKSRLSKVLLLTEKSNRLEVKFWSFLLICRENVQMTLNWIEFGHLMFVVCWCSTGVMFIVFMRILHTSNPRQQERT